MDTPPKGAAVARKVLKQTATCGEGDGTDHRDVSTVRPTASQDESRRRNDNDDDEQSNKRMSSNGGLLAGGSGEVQVGALYTAQIDDDRPVKSDIVNGWFSEWIEFSCSGQAMCLKVDEVLFHEKSPYQDVLVFKSSTYGNVLILDGIINCTERDEFAYQEMLTHLALCSHPQPYSVLIIGGGDGGVAREVIKHDVVQRVVQCEIDAVVVNACKKFLPAMAKGFSDKRMELIIGDGFAYMDEHVNEFDVIITDSSDPEGPAETLFGSEYYQRMFRALKPNGLLISQGQTMWIPKEVNAITPLLKELRGIFTVVNYSYTFIPTYTMGQIGFIMASKNPETNFTEPLRVLSEEQIEKMKLKYYNADVHRASFVMPQFIRKVLPV